MNANWLAAMLAFTFFVFITIRGELTQYAGIVGIGPGK